MMMMTMMVMIEQNLQQIKLLLLFDILWLCDKWCLLLLNCGSIDCVTIVSSSFNGQFGVVIVFVWLAMFIYLFSSHEMSDWNWEEEEEERSIRFEMRIKSDREWGWEERFWTTREKISLSLPSFMENRDGNGEREMEAWKGRGREMYKVREEREDLSRDWYFGRSLSLISLSC